MAGGVAVTNGGLVELVDYPSDSACTWQLKCSDNSLSPVLHFNTINLEMNGDYLTVFDGETSAGNRLGRFAGSFRRSL